MKRGKENEREERRDATEMKNREKMRKEKCGRKEEGMKLGKENERKKKKTQSRNEERKDN